MAIGGSACMVQSNDTLFTISFDDNKFSRLVFRSFNRNGMLLDSTYYHFSDTNNVLVSIRGNSLDRISGNSLVSIHDFFRTDNMNFSRLIKTNNSLDTIKTSVFYPDSAMSYNSWDVLVEDTAITVLGHFTGSNKKLHLFLARFDTALDLQWYSTIQDFRPIVNQYYNGYYPYRLRRMGNNYYIAGRCLYTTQFVEGFLVKTDLQGNLIWDKRYMFNGLNSAISDFEILNQDTIVTCAGLLSKMENNIPYGKVQFNYFDTAGIIIKDTLYPEEEIVYFPEKIKSHDGNLLVIGNYFLDGSKAVIWKLDKNLNTIWRRVYYYGDWEDESWLYNVDQWSDGGIIAAGTYWDRYMNPTNKSVYLWLLSTDSLGCLSPGNCGSDINVVEWALPGQGLKVFPNPATDLVNIELSTPGNSNATATARLFNEAGQVVLKENIEFVDGLAQVGLPPIGRGSFVLEVKTATHVFYEKIIIQ